MYEYSYKKYTTFVVLTEKDKKAWKGFKNINVIPNFINLPSKISSYQFRSNKIIFVGSLNDDRKGLKGILDFWILNNLKFTNWELHVFGDGKLRQDLENYSTSSNLSNKVVFHGVEKNIELIYNDAKLMVSASMAEGLPMVMLAAQSYGIPIVAFDCYCGPSVIVNGTNGRLVKQGDFNALMEEVLSLVNQDVLMNEYSVNSFKLEKKFDEGVIMIKWKDLYNSLNC